MAIGSEVVLYSLKTDRVKLPAMAEKRDAVTAELDEAEPATAAAGVREVADSIN